MFLELLATCQTSLLIHVCVGYTFLGLRGGCYKLAQNPF